MRTPIATSSTVKAILFDIDGVLLDSRRANIEFYRAFLAEHGYAAISEEVLAHGHHMNLRQAIAFMTQAPDERVDELWQLASPLQDYPDHLLSLPDGCRESLEALAPHFRLAIVTGRMWAGIDHFFRFSGLEALFAAAVGYEDYARAKPDGEPLLVACRRLGVEPRHAVYVGDAPLDYESALAAGTQFIAYGDGIECARLRASSFHELSELLERLAR